ncbi:hypothetical protein BM221_002684 [Beauveria bassiana]|uniref:Uncharacterized protein n=1 Tax=Beauveria bassiana TaxID=176275 RepID=A0A2N6NZ89_BEABA|nr:hypothetical protein BM221_002684 [Beauveria bassiana]
MAVTTTIIIAPSQSTQLMPSIYDIDFSIFTQLGEFQRQNASDSPPYQTPYPGTTSPDTSE